MNTSTNTLLPARTLIGYGDRRFTIYPDEITTFLMSCNDAGLPTIKDIVDDLDDISDIVINSNIKDAATLKRYLKLLRIISLGTQGAIHEEL